MAKRNTQKAVFAVLPGGPVCGHWHGVEFLTEEQLVERGETVAVNGTDTVLALTDEALQGKFWVTDIWEVVSTSDAIKSFASGSPVKGYTGPHDTEVSAENCVDAAWEAPGNE